MRAIVAHRSDVAPQAARRRADELAEWSLVVSSEDGADAIGAVVVEQPDLLLVEDRLASVSRRWTSPAGRGC